MKQSDDFRGNAENCAQLAERWKDEPTFKRYKRMEAAWRALAEERKQNAEPCGQFVPIAAYPAPSVDGGLGAWLSAPLALSADEAR